MNVDELRKRIQETPAGQVVNLRGEDLRGINLFGILFAKRWQDPIETRANLTGANLTDADLTGANLTRADLTGANLTGANLTRADLTGANLTRANLTRADLTGANLTRADLTGANLTAIRDDIWKILDFAAAEVPALRLALVESRVNGQMYRGECACLVGTIANVRGCPLGDLAGIVPNCERPAERWFLAINPWLSHKHPIVAQTIAWIDEWTAEQADRTEPVAAS